MHKAIDDIKYPEFYIDEYMSNIFGSKKIESKVIDISRDKKTRFENICNTIKEHFDNEWDSADGSTNYETILERQKKAILGYEKEVHFFKDKIREYIRDNNLENDWFPGWYKDLVDGIFQENWGLAGISEWNEGDKEELKMSSSAKIIGDRIYFLINGRQVLQRQTISKDRRKQLVKALLLKTPKARNDRYYHEVYMIDGKRITIYGEGITKEGQDVIVFRRDIVPDYSFELQADKGTIPYEAIEMFKSMVNVGFNVAFTGAVRTAKTTFLKTWQSYENQNLEGVQIETDPEIPLHNIMPNAPVIQLVADEEDLKGIVKSIMRSDGDYIIMAEARDGIALNIAVKVANKGTRRCKITFHTSDTIDFCYDVADEIVKVYGGDLYSNIVKVAKSFHYVFQFVQLKDKSKKRLKGIYEIRYNPLDHEITIHQICKYNFKTDDWTFKYDIGADKGVIGEEEDEESFEVFKSELKRLSEKYPMKEENTFTPSYHHLRRGI